MSAADKAKEKIIGIDLGTTNSCAAIVESGHPKIIPSAKGISHGALSCGFLMRKITC